MLDCHQGFEAGRNVEQLIRTLPSHSRCLCCCLLSWVDAPASPKKMRARNLLLWTLGGEWPFQRRSQYQSNSQISSRVTWLVLNLDLGISLEPLDRLAEAGSSTPSPVVSRGSAWKWGRLLSANDTAKVILRKVS